MSFFIKAFKNTLGFLTSNKFILLSTFILNIIILILLTIFVSMWSYLYVTFFAFVLAIFMIAFSKDALVYKFSWLLTMILVPLFGTTLYIYMQGLKITKRKQRKWGEIQARNEQCFCESVPSVSTSKLDKSQERLANYIKSITCMPLTGDNSTIYYSNGTAYFEDIIEEIRNAKEYIYIEFFIIREGILWDRMLQALTEKAKAGVEVKILYDDFGCIDIFTRKQKKQIHDSGIEMKEFNKIRPMLTRYVNYRDHRKIVVVDGQVAFTGGLNLADEYANIIERFGYWKDSGIKIRGGAVQSLMVLFGTNWEIANGQSLPPKRLVGSAVPNWGGGEILQVFGSGPLNSTRIAQKNYINLINNAKDHVYISSPYFILDEETKNALKTAALSGVKVKVILPGIPDKKLIFEIGRTYYPELIEQGVEIYELTGNFVHAKMVEIDDKTASIGTTNFDFRSLYLHFEDTVMLYNSHTVNEIHNDFNNMIADAKKIDLENLPKKNFFYRLAVSIAKLFVTLL